MATTGLLSTPSRDLAAIVQAFTAMIRSNLRHRAEFNRVRSELACMTDRELTDIGIARADIPTIADKAATRVQ